MNVYRFVLLFIFAWTAETTERVNIISRPVQRIGEVLDEITNVSAGAVKLALQAMDTGIKAGVETRNIINDRFRQIIEDFRKKMAEGIPELKIPPLEPFNLGHADININHEIGKIKGTLDNVTISKLSQFELEYINVTPLKFLVGVNITLPILKIRGNYDINGEIGDLFKIYGKGPFNLTVDNIAVGINIGLHFTTHFSVRDLNLTISIKSMKCNFENLMGGGTTGDVFNKVIGDLAPEALNFLWPELEPTVSKKIIKVVDEKLGLITIRDILCMFNPACKN